MRGKSSLVLEPLFDVDQLAVDLVDLAFSSIYFDMINADDENFLWELNDLTSDATRRVTDLRRWRLR